MLIMEQVDHRDLLAEFQEEVDNCGIQIIDYRSMFSQIE